MYIYRCMNVVTHDADLIYVLLSDTSEAFKPSSPPQPSTPRKSKGKKRKISSPLFVRGSSDEENDNRYASPSPVKWRKVSRSTGKEY